jgi:hypothetical protein
VKAAALLALVVAAPAHAVALQPCSDVRFCADVAVSGTVLWRRASGAVHASISFRTTPAVLAWSLASLAPAQLRGHADRATGAPLALRLLLPAP